MGSDGNLYAGDTGWHWDGWHRDITHIKMAFYLDPVARDTGCLRVIPGSHAAKITHPHLLEDRQNLVLQQRMADNTFDEAAAVDLQLQPGQMSMHDVYMIHGARVNHSTQRRTGVALRYMPTTSVFERDLRPVEGNAGVTVNFAERPLWLVRGVDRSGRNDLTIGHRR